jgi:hypothetical protein
MTCHLLDGEECINIAHRRPGSGTQYEVCGYAVEYEKNPV